jgi:hypothetical protein
MGSYGNGQILDSSIYAWVIPWKVIAIVLLAILILWTIVKKLIDSSKTQVNVLESKLEKEEEEIETLKKALKDRK